LLVAENILSAVNDLHYCKHFARFACFFFRLLQYVK